MQHFWVVGTDTEVGKTCVTTLLMRQLQQQGFRVTPYKPVQTGEVYRDGESYYHDTEMYEKYSLQMLDLDNLNGYSFKEAASPHFAAQLEGQQINTQHLLKQLQMLQQSYDVVICEGAGGLFVPLDIIGEMTLLDVIVQSKLPVVVVTRTTLGTINHTLLTLESLQSRDIEVLGIVFNGDTGSPIEQSNIETILQYHALPYATIPQFQNISEIVEYAITDTTLFERLYRHEICIN
ncbi:dethiobiotin synthase [Lysinibacillus sphaericus]|uniref:ATP-dependent dethiobiotin synthetase BioD n=1 Tax=Lysinibacillus sphaericus OT4b.31 TaxID=1285586 RepID=R7ZD19_LYSSH|nr:dethiobiotin synthase [Lysinibacillus sphaericus]EON72030.1 dethiobiotin synthetase [Lysinibacillus sphaericus OT4b.31]